MSKQVGKLKKFFRFGSRSTSQSRSDSPSPSVAPLDVAAPSPPVLAATPLVSSSSPDDAPAPVYPDIVPPDDPRSSADLVSTVSSTDHRGVAALPLVSSSPADLVSTRSTTDPLPSVNPAPAVTMTQEEAVKLRGTYTHFRILIIGRANAGKTTLLKRVCNTKEDPVYDRVSYQALYLISPYHSIFNRLIRPRRC